MHGFAVLGTSSFGLADFDNVRISEPKNRVKYTDWSYTEMEYSEQILVQTFDKV